MVTARLAARRLDDAGINGEVGAYLLGATAPDVRIMTGQPRQDTHYISLEAAHPESSIENLYGANPHLKQVTGRGRAFLAGYLTHLEVDQAWIHMVYRPFFGRDSVHQGSLEANFMDRTLQFYMDWKERQDRDLVQAFYDQVVAAELAEELPLIAPPTLQEWQGFVKRILKNEPSWDWFSDFLQRRLKVESNVTDEELQRLALGLPEVLERVLSYVTPERLQAFREEAITRQTAAIRSFVL